MFNSPSKTKVGIIWSAIERFSTQGVQFFISIILARLLLPEDYGLIAVVNIFLIIFQTINETGFGAALMQKLDRDDLDFSSVFVFNILLGVFLYILLFGAAPWIAEFFANSQLTLLIRVIGLNLIISSFVIIQRARLMISIDFKTQAKASFIAAVFSGVIGIWCAYNGFGVMSLVIQSLVNNLVATILIWYYVNYSVTFKFSFKRFNRLFNFAYKLTLARLINVIYNEISVVLIGKWISPIQLGYYNRAMGFQTLPSSNITGLIQRVSTPVLCELQNDKEAMVNSLRSFIVKTSACVFPIMMIMLVLAKPMVQVLLTDKWLPCVPMLQMLCPVGMIYVINTFNLNIFNALNRTDLAFKLEIYKKIFSVALIVFALKYGIMAILLMQVMVSLLELFFNTYFTKKLIGYGLWNQIKSLIPILISTIVMSVFIIVLVRFLSDNILKLVVGSIIGGTIYFLMIKLFKIKF